MPDIRSKARIGTGAGPSSRVHPGRSVFALGLVGCLLLPSGCKTEPPPNWQEGGAPLVIPSARWDRRHAPTIRIASDGTVTRDHRKILFVDRAGRIVDRKNEPVAILLRDGHLVGEEHVLFGRIGLGNASPPGSATAWLSISRDGDVTWFDAEGERLPFGRWMGCEGASLRTCTLVTHLIALDGTPREQGPSVGVGVGVGIGY